MMVPTYHEPNANRKVLKYFGLEESADLPCFIVFMWDDNNQLCQIDWKIDDYSVDTAYNSIKEVVELISKAAQKAYKRANILAKAVNSTVFGINNINTSCSTDGNRQPRLYMAKNMLAATADAAPETASGMSISNGVIKINANVNASFFVK